MESSLEIWMLSFCSDMLSCSVERDDFDGEPS